MPLFSFLIVLDAAFALFTVTVALVVAFTNAQNFSGRFQDLKANCADLYESFLECVRLSRENTPGPELNQKVAQILDDYNGKLADSEDHGLVDYCKYHQPFWYAVYLAVGTAFVVFLFAVPLVFVWRNWAPTLQCYFQ